MFPRPSHQAIVRRLLISNPTLGITLAELVEQRREEEFLSAVDAITALGKKILHVTKDVRPAYEFMRAGEITDKVRFSPVGRDTRVYQFQRDGKNYRLWHWIHADDKETGQEAMIFEESSIRSQIELAYYDD
jgi:hypothetical protein